jgi:hypothetical protein
VALAEIIAKKDVCFTNRRHVAIRYAWIEDRWAAMALWSTGALLVIDVAWQRRRG